MLRGSDEQQRVARSRHVASMEAPGPRRGFQIGAGRSLSQKGVDAVFTQTSERSSGPELPAVRPADPRQWCGPTTTVTDAASWVIDAPTLMLVAHGSRPWV